MSGLVHKMFFPGVAPFLQAKALQMPFPEKFKTILAHPAGPFTIHFWAPALKWGICIANLVDMKKQKIENTSVPQQLAVAATGLIWSRYSMVITPKNWSLFSVNMAMAITGTMQLYRVFTYQMAEKEKLSQLPEPSNPVGPASVKRDAKEQVQRR